jgi:hypothetical protein
MRRVALIVQKVSKVMCCLYGKVLLFTYDLTITH